MNEENNELNILLENIKTIKTFEKDIRSMSIFPSGNLLSISGVNSIKIYDINFNLLQNIIPKNREWICYSDIKDENTFLVSSEKNIVLYTKNEGKFTINKIIKTNHKNIVLKVSFLPNGNIISASVDNTIKIYEEKDDKEYQNVITIVNLKIIRSFMLLEDKKILVTSGDDGTKFWNYNNYEEIYSFNNVICGFWNSIIRIDDNKILIGGKSSFYIILLNEKKIIEIQNKFYCNGICYVKDILIVVGGIDIKIYNNKNYQCLRSIQDISITSNNGVIQLKNGLIVTYTSIGIIKIWEIKNNK
jgi:WD40 repeat protein